MRCLHLLDFKSQYIYFGEICLHFLVQKSFKNCFRHEKKYPTCEKAHYIYCCPAVISAFPMFLK